MKLTLDFSKPFYHGSNLQLEVLRTGSTVTQWEALARAFSHKPTVLCYEDDGTISHNGTQKGYLYVVDEMVLAGDIIAHPRTTMDENAEFLTCRELKLRLIEEDCG